jgi:hypothetical protein
MQQQIRAHIEAQFARAQLQHYPFPHLIIENFFPQAIFDDILRFNPFKNNHGSEWISKRQSRALKTSTPYFARKQINLHKDETFQASADEQAFWAAIKQCFIGDHWFTQLVLNKYKEFFIIRFGELIEDPAFLDMLKHELFLQRHEPGYYIGPHTDIPTRIFTCIFSFAERAGFEQFGTELCKPCDPLARCWGNDHYAPDDFVVTKVAPYTPNNFLLFFKTRQSFHAVRAIDDTVPNQRYGMQFQLYEPAGGLFHDLSEPELLSTRHRRSRIDALLARFGRLTG